MKNKKLIGVLAAVLAVIIVAVVVLVVVLAGKDNPDGNEGNGEIIWTDSVPPEEVDPPAVNNDYVVLPQKPTSAPPAADSANAPSVGGFSASNECYTISEESGKTVVTYNSEEALPAYAYVYVKVENYQPKYQFLKIKGNFTGVQRITVLAVYYEQYELSRPAVTVYNNALVEGENTIVADFDDATVQDKAYNVAVGEKLKDKTVIGFIIMLDSNPKQVIDEYSGSVTFNEISVVDETDGDLAQLYAPPFISAWSGEDVGYDSIEIETSDGTTGNKDAVIDYSFAAGGFPFVTATIMNYKPDYTTLKLKLRGQNVKNLTIAIAYSLRTNATSQTFNYITEYGMQVPTVEETIEIDFSMVEELGADFVSTIPGSYVKNLKPTALYFYIDTADNGSGNTGGLGTLYVSDIEFIKAVDDGTPRVTSTWTVTGEGMNKSEVTNGGSGTLRYNKTQGWTPVTVNVASYNSEYTTVEIRVKFYGAKNLGIALGYGSNNTVIQNSDGNTDTGVVLTHTEQEGTDENGDYVFHVYSIDFSGVKTASGENLYEQSINKIMFYIDAGTFDGSGNWKEVSEGSNISERMMQFVGIEFKKPTQA